MAFKMRISLQAQILIFLVLEMLQLSVDLGWQDSLTHGCCCNFGRYRYWKLSLLIGARVIVILYHLCSIIPFLLYFNLCQKICVVKQLYYVHFLLAKSSSFPKFPSTTIHYLSKPVCHQYSFSKLLFHLESIISASLSTGSPITQASKFLDPIYIPC